MSHSGQTVDIVSDRTLPIQSRWMLVNALETTWAGVLLLAVLIWIGGFRTLDHVVAFVIVGILIIAVTIHGMWRKSGFHFVLTNDAFSVTDHWHNSVIPFGRINKVSVKQNIFDRLFNVFEVLIEVDHPTWSPPARHENIGILGNKIVVPGLTKKDAEELRRIITYKARC